MLSPKNVYKRITGVSAKNIVKTYLLKLMSVKTEKKQIISVGIIGEETPRAKIFTLFFLIILYIFGYLSISLF